MGLGAQDDEAGRRSILVTGASGGIGRSTVAALVERDLAVWAAVRTEAAARQVRAEFGARIRTVVFDLTDDAAVREAAAEVIAAGPLYGLANIAGAALPGPLEYVPIEQFRRQLDINVTGQLQVTQALLPALRAGARTWGDARIVLMGSLDARIVGPLFGPYAASKHALVGLADALRSELHPAGIKVSLLEPGVIATPIWRRGTGVLGELQPTLPDRGGPYRSIMNFARRYVSRLSGFGTSPDRVAEAVLRAMMSRSPSPRQVVGVDARIVTALLLVLPPRAIYRLTALPRIGSARHGGP
ncbi:SDR family NAD(P)-dependent oxidoreductase [Microlunatus parietis]|uniref:NAD(P)-dependent dehydrogenase (Short-subunit alcohol dehydrogenase family) n=1 Tax=Microlunatus parietis TaxID=682979 RepID=A0A7Y9IC48_9ACTN|nr:SDR family NAD(P)-dependent oxidoreductase [Microlunatus parietis]NYE73868.1 NAD(P)-dependent dehydrogenase (short-subunit alcohol dehydrogenase family) [Microlunatus parietis]